MNKKKPSVNRLQARQVDKKFTQAVKVLSNYMHNTTQVSDDLIGYKTNAGHFTDKNGIEWQVQAYAVCSKKHQIKKDEILPIVRKWAIGLRIRVFIKYVIEKVFN